MTADGVYPDFPECLLRYAWLVEGSDGRGLYTGGDAPARCKACGASVPINQQARHRREHLRQLARMRKQLEQARRRRAAVRRRELNRLRREK